MHTGVTIADMTALYKHYQTKDDPTNEDQRRLKRIGILLNKLTDGLQETPVKEPEAMRWGP